LRHLEARLAACAATAADLYPMVLTFDAMLDEKWTRRTVRGWERGLGKLTKLRDV